VVVNFVEFGLVQFLMSFSPALHKVKLHEADWSHAASAQFSKEHVAVAAAFVDCEEWVVLCFTLEEIEV
jgi:hypothetical protein